MSHDFGDTPEVQSMDPNRDNNPYASPLAEGPLLAKLQQREEPIGIWRTGSSLLMHRLAELPDRCVRTNLICDKSERHVLILDSRSKTRIIQGAVMIGGAILTVIFFAAPKIPNREYPAILTAVLTLLISWLSGLRRSEEMAFAYSYSHRSRLARMKWRYAGASLFCVGHLLFLPAIAFALINWLVAVLVIIALMSIAVGAITFAIASFPLRIERNAGNYILIQGCGDAFVKSFPDAGIQIDFLGQLATTAFFSNVLSRTHF